MTGTETLFNNTPYTVVREDFVFFSVVLYAHRSPAMRSLVVAALLQQLLDDSLQKNIFTGNDFNYSRK